MNTATRRPSQRRRCLSTWCVSLSLIGSLLLLSRCTPLVGAQIQYPPKLLQYSTLQKSRSAHHQRKEKYARSLLNELKPRIHGGWDTEVDRYSYAQVSLETIDDGHQCGGSLIAIDVILTAAHCAGNYDRIVVGRHNIYDETDESEIFDALLEIVHPEYDDVTTRFDVMLIILDGWTSMATPVRVNNDTNVPADGQDLRVVGWGYDHNWELPEMLQETEVIYTRNIDCIQYKDARGNTLKPDLYADMMCAGDDGRDSCYGDSGSPLILIGDTIEQDIQVGLVSWGYECAGDLPGIYSRLAFWKTYNFILEIVCEHSISPGSYMSCGSGTPVTTSLPTQAPTDSPSESPSEWLSESPTAQVFPPTAEPTTASLQESSQGSSAGKVDNNEGQQQQQYFDDAFYFAGEQSANGSHNGLQGSSAATSSFQGFSVSFCGAVALTTFLMGALWTL